MADHDYKEGGWREKYIVHKRCTDCAGTAVVRKEDADKCPVHCATCNGTGMTPINPEAIYFVLRLDEDPHAVKAAMAYAKSVRDENPRFADDILRKLHEIAEAKHPEVFC